VRNGANAPRVSSPSSSSPTAAAHFAMRAERFFFDENKENYIEEERRKHERARTMVLHPRLCKRSRTHEGCAQSHSLSFVVRVFVRVVLVVVPLV
jgi:hypothetical protein